MDSPTCSYHQRGIEHLEGQKKLLVELKNLVVRAWIVRPFLTIRLIVIQGSKLDSSKLRDEPLVDRSKSLQDEIESSTKE
jgi:hypothetical protein